ncbi:hypothetical protein ABZS77_21885 [Micromonospora sp. NPDC005298]
MTSGGTAKTATHARANGADLEDRQHHEPETESASAKATADYQRALGIAQ